MKEIKVKKDDLLRHLKEERDKHVTEYLEALRGWRQKVMETLAAELERLQNPDEEPNLYPFQTMPKPVSYEGSYDEAIAICEWEQGEEMTLDFQQFNQWVRGEFTWRQMFRATNSAYSGASLD